MLRYYERIDLLPSLKQEQYAYRVYDERGIARLQQILILRKLRIPLKQIGRVFEDPSAKNPAECVGAKPAGNLR